MLLLTNIALAGDFCLTNSTVIHNSTINGIIVSIEENCNYGCDLATNSCTPSPLESRLWIAGIVIFLIFLTLMFKQMLRL